jgi:hypothetical protein
MPLGVISAIKVGDRSQAISVLQQIEEETYKEIERCFPDPERTARGGYSIIK